MRSVDRPIAATCVALAMLLAVPATAGASTPSPIVRKLNAFRAHHGLGPLRYSPSLARSSTRFAHYIARSDRFGHASRIRASASFRLLGEALAYTRGWRIRRSYVIRRLLRSPGHRPLLLSRTFNYVGVGRVRGRLGRGRATVWVLQFGRK